MRKIIGTKVVILLIFGAILAFIGFSDVPRVASADGDSVVIAAGDAQGVVVAIQTANQRGATATPFKIYLAAGEYAFYAPDQTGQPSLPEVTGNVVIYGQNTRIALYNTENALEHAQLRIAAKAKAELYNLVFLVQSGSGRAILNRGTLVVSDSKFGESLGEGGGIENQSNLTIERTQFTHNQYISSTEPGGALYNNGVLTATCARFVEGLASQGGAIFNTARGKTTVTQSAFDGNRANGGGAIFNESIGPVSAAGNWWSIGTPRVDDHYRGVDTVSKGVDFDPTARVDPTQGADCQPLAPVQSPGGASNASSTPTPGVSAPTGTGQTRIIVGLKTAFAPELSLSGTQAAQEQQSRILQTGSQLLASLKGHNIKVNAQYTLFPYLALSVDAGAFQVLSSSPLVTSIQPDELSAPTDNPSTLLTGAQNTWSVGYDGTGWAVAVLDTGVDKTHPFLTGKVVSEACFSTTDGTFSTSLCPGGAASSTAVGSGQDCPTSVSGCGHGTHVAGIAAGLNGSFGSETFSGMARGANIIAIKIFSQINDTATCNGFGRPAPCALVYHTDQVSGLEHVATLVSSFNIAAANMSLGGGKYTTQASCDAANGSKKAAIDALRAANIATVIASGNNGYTDGISAPGCISTAVSVGATNFSDVVANFSNSASFLSLLAPGVGVLSSTEGGSYDYWDGTSMATPQVAGAWVILKQRMPGATVTQLLTALQNTGVPVLDSRNGITKPRIQVDAALNSLGPITVTNTADSGTSSLRAALTFANAQNSLTTINFNITGAGVKTISPVSTLPTLTKPVVIDGYTQPGAVAATSSTPATLLIALDGASAGTTSGLTLTGGNSMVRGLVIDHFAQNGITLTTNGSNIISGNYIGVNAAGTTAAANSGNGIAILSGANNTIGGTTADAPNIVAYNSAVGVAVTGTSGNNILTNRIFSNTGLGIDLLSGANANQAAPVLASALTNGSSTLTVNGTLNSTASTTFRLEFFSNTSCDSSGAGEGETYLGTTNVTTNGSGNASFNTTLSGAVAWGKAITATASGTNGTSEFSTCVTALSAVTQTAPIGTITSRNPTFTWQSVLQATQYKVWVGTSGGATLLNQAYSSAVCSGGTCSITPTLDLSSGYYAWWIVPNGPAGDGLATGQGFTVAIMPGAITQTAPIGTVSTRNPAFTWQADRDATWYSVWIGTSDGTTLLNQAYIATDVCSGTTCTVSPTLDLSSGYYAWWIAPNGIAGKGPATGQGFTVAILPGTVVQSAPTGTISTRNPTFTWQADRDATWYGVWVGKSDGTTLINPAYIASDVCSGTTCSVSPTLDLSSGYYSWWIVANGIAGKGTATGQGFTVSILPGAVVQTAPSGNISTPNPTFGWQADRDASGYSLWIGTSGGSTLLSETYNAATVCSGTTCSIAPTLNLAPGSYSWWITAWGIAGSGPSSGMGFTVMP